MKSCLYAGALLLLQVHFLFAQISRNSTATNAFSEPRRISSASLKNLHQLGAAVYSGATPENQAAFAELQKLGVKTIISVDGAKPDTETAKAFGFRYVHLPIGYDSVPTNRVLELVKAADVLPGSIYVHCHHGEHRGPTAAAMICLGTEGWSPEKALAWMKQAGTATNYAGLYQSVRQFQRPSAEVLSRVAENFPEKVEVSPLVDAMVSIDERFEHLKLIQDAGYQPPAAHPDLSPEHEAFLFYELWRELPRAAHVQQRGAEFDLQMKEAAEAAENLHSELSAFLKDRSSARKEKLEAHFQRVSNSCRSCHKAFRN